MARFLWPVDDRINEGASLLKKGLELKSFKQTHFIKKMFSFFGDLFIKQAGYKCKCNGYPFSMKCIQKWYLFCQNGFLRSKRCVGEAALESVPPP